MSPMVKGLLATALTLPLVAFVAGVLAAPDPVDPDRSRPVIIGRVNDDAPTEKPTQTVSERAENRSGDRPGGDDRDDRGGRDDDGDDDRDDEDGTVAPPGTVVTPQPRDLDGDDDDGDDGDDDDSDDRGESDDD